MKKPYTIAISGGTCSGKSTLAKALSESFGEYKLCIINMDSFFKKDVPVVTAPITKKLYKEHNHPDTLNKPDLFAAINKALSEDYDILIIEGLFALYFDEIKSVADLKVFVDLQSDERLVRRIKRFQSYGESFDEITQRYLDTVRFRHNELVEPTRWFADIVVNGNFQYNNSTEILRQYILQHLRGEL